MSLLRRLLQVNPDIRKDKWTEDEDRRLMELVRIHGSCWAEISRGMHVSLQKQGLPAASSCALRQPGLGFGPAFVKA